MPTFKLNNKPTRVQNSMNVGVPCTQQPDVLLYECMPIYFVVAVIWSSVSCCSLSSDRTPCIAYPQSSLWCQSPKPFTMVALEKSQWQARATRHSFLTGLVLINTTQGYQQSHLHCFHLKFPLLPFSFHFFLGHEPLKIHYLHHLHKGRIKITKNV